MDLKKSFKTKSDATSAEIKELLKEHGNKKIGEEIKALQLLGCSYCKALTLNLLQKLLPILTLLNRRGRQPTSLQPWNEVYRCRNNNTCQAVVEICGAIGGLKQGSTSTTLVTKAS